jgi:hypothetical protein
VLGCSKYHGENARTTNSRTVTTMCGGGWRAAAAVQDWREQPDGAAHEDANERHSSLPYLLAVLSRVSTTTRRFRGCGEAKLSSCDGGAARVSRLR